MKDTRIKRVAPMFQETAESGRWQAQIPKKKERKKETTWCYWMKLWWWSLNCNEDFRMLEMPGPWFIHLLMTDADTEWNQLKKWSHTLKTRTRGQTDQGCWCPGDSITRPKCQTWNCSISFFSSAFRVSIWPNISLLGSYSSFLKLNVYSVHCVLEKDSLVCSLLF